MKYSTFLLAGTLLCLNLTSDAQANPAWGGLNDTPQLLAPGIINTGLITRDVTMTPDGRELYFSAATAGYGHGCILVTRFVDGNWSLPEVVSFSGHPDQVDIEPALSPDGQSLFFYSTRPLKEGGEAAQDLWVVHRAGSGWGEPENLGAPVNSDDPEFFPSVTADGTLYFCRSNPTDRTHAIFRSRLVGGAYQDPERMPAAVNSGASQFNAWVSPDESRLIVPVAGHPDNFGGVDYWLCRRNDDDTWQAPRNLGPVVNDGSRQSWSPYVSPDGEAFFFMSGRTVGAEMPWPVSWSELQRRHRRPGSGRPGIYVMKAKFLDRLEDATEKAVVAQDITPASPAATNANTPGKYWGQDLPGLEPEIFAPGRVSTGLTERDLVLSPDGRHLLYGVMDLGLVTNMYAEWNGDRWSEPVSAPWHRDPDFACFEPTFTPDGNTVCFLSNRAAPGQEPKPGWGNQNIFTSHFDGKSWSEAEALPAPVTTAQAEYFPSLASDGSLYFSRENEAGNSEIWMAPATAAGFAEPAKLPATVNVGENNYNAFVAPDQSLIIVCVGGHDENLGAGDYWISFRGDDGAWLPARNLGPKFNGEHTRASSAFMSPDGQVLFFSSTRRVGPESRSGERLTRAKLLTMLTEPGMGSSDLWWVDAAVLEAFRP